MNSMLNRTLRLARVIALVGFTASALVHAKEQTPVDVLKDQGLKRSSGAAWVVTRETDFLKEVRRAQALSVQLRIAQQQQLALETGAQNPQVLINNYREQV